VDYRNTIGVWIASPHMLAMETCRNS
jgi:hypothetical protein